MKTVWTLVAGLTLLLTVGAGDAAAAAQAGDAGQTSDSARAGRRSKKHRTKKNAKTTAKHAKLASRHHRKTRTALLSSTAHAPFATATDGASDAQVAAPLRPSPAAGQRRKRDRRRSSQLALRAPLVAAPTAAPGIDVAHRRQIERAESAARAPDRPDRWETVRFLLSGVDRRTYPQACFWLVLADYRSGALDRGDAERTPCTLAAGDVETLDRERKEAAALQGKSPPPAASDRGALAENDGLPPVRNFLPYDGPAPRTALNESTP